MERGASANLRFVFETKSFREAARIEVLERFFVRQVRGWLTLPARSHTMPPGKSAVIAA
jgi:hypothetical protein